MLSTLAIVFLAIGSTLAFALLVYLLWPWIETCWKQPSTQALAEGATVGRQAITGVNVNVPPLYSPA